MNLLDTYVGAVEDELLDVEGVRRLKGKGKAKELGSDWVRDYEFIIEAFEKRWSEDWRQFESWEILPSTSSSSCSTSTTNPLPTFSIPSSWIQGLPNSNSQGESIHEFMKLLVKDPGMLGGSIATLEGNELSSILLPLPSPSSSSSTTTISSSPLGTLLSLVMALRGPRSTLDFLVGIWETALREIVGREKYQKTERNDGVADFKGITGKGMKGGRGSREKELENFLVGVLEILDSMGLSLDYHEEESLVKEGAHRGTGPFNLSSRPLESILLEFLHSLSELPLPSPPPSSVTSTATSTSNPWSTLTSTITGLPMQVVGLPMMGYDTLLSAGTGLSNVAMQGVGTLFPSPLSGTSSPSATSGSSKSTLPPSDPTASRFLPSPPSSNALNQLLVRTATQLLTLLTPSRSSSLSSIPMLQVLLQHLLSSDGLGEAEKKKVQLLALVRFWGFSWLGRKLAKLGAGGGFTHCAFGTGVQLSSANGDGGAGAARRRTGGISSSALLDEIYVGIKEKGRFAGLHKVIYDALVAEVHGGKEETPVKDGVRRASEQKEKALLARAAKAFISGFIHPSIETATPRSNEEKEQTGVKVFHLGSDDFRILFESFGGLVVRGVASGPSSKMPIIPTFKRATSFKSGSPTSTSTSIPTPTHRATEEAPHRSHSFADSSLFTSASSTSPSLADRLHEVIEDLSMIRSRKSGKALIFCCSRSSRSEDEPELETSGRIPDFQLHAISRPTQESKRNTHETPVRKARVEDSEVDWISPPQSPRHEALGLGAGNSSNLFGIRIEKSPEEEVDGKQLTEEERSILTRTVVLLSKSGRISSTRGGTGDVFSKLSSRFFVDQLYQEVKVGVRYYHDHHDFVSHVLCSQASNILNHYSTSNNSIYPSILSQIARSFETLRRLSESILRTAQNRISELDSEKSNLLNAVRIERSALDDLRVRAWYSSLKLTENYRQLTLRLEEIAMPRTESERKEGQQVLEAWSNELGVYSFMKSRNTSLEESLRLVEIFVTISMEPKSFYASGFWRKESEVVQNLMASRRTGLGMGAAAKSFAEVLVAGGSSILTAPLTLAAMATTVVLPSTAFPTSAATSTTDAPLSSSSQSTIILSFGAATPSLLKPHETTTVFKSAIEEHLLRIHLKLSGLLWSDLTRTLVSNRDSDYKLLGCDSWMAEFAGPLSPLKRDRSAGGDGKPLVFSTSGLEKSEEYFGVILERFVRHPSPHAKLLALYELETVLTATLSAPSFEIATTIPTILSSSPSFQSDHASISTSKPKEYLAKLTGLLNKRMSIAPSAISLLLEGEESDLGGEGIVDGGHNFSPSLRRSPSIFSERSSFAPSPSRKHDRLGSITSIGSQDTLLQQHPVLLLASPSPSGSAPPAAHQESSPRPPTTDDLLLSLEHILLHYPQQEIYQSLQIISSLLPSKVLDTGPLGKAFWDFALAALARKREVVEGPKGIVERGLDALAEGEDGIEVARRLLGIGECPELFLLTAQSLFTELLFWWTAAKEESQIALEMLERLGTVDGRRAGRV